MAQVKYYDKRVGITYVYESQSYYDPEKHQSRSKRKLIGKIDPETGELIPTGKRGRPRKEPDTAQQSDVNYKKLYEKAQAEISKKQERIAELEQELCSSKAAGRNYRQILQEISNLCTIDDR